MRNPVDEYAETMIYPYLPKAKRKAASLRMLAAKKAKRLRLGVDAETLRSRFTHTHKNT